MKKLLLILLALSMCVSMCACGTNPFDMSKEAYEKISTAYDIIDAYGSDIYEAWRLGIYSDDDILKKGNTFLASELGLEKSELDEGLAYTIATSVYEKEWDSLTDEEKEEYREYADSDTACYKIFEDELFSMCIKVVSSTYKVNGKSGEISSNLEEAKRIMKDMSNDHADYEHYPNLKGFYTSTSAFFEFCEDPSGSFEQVKDTLNNYRKEARDFKKDLDYIFEE